MAKAAGTYRILWGCTERAHAQDEASTVEVDLSGFYSEIAAIFGAESINIKRIVSGLGLAAPALALNEEHCKEIDRLRGSVKQLTERVVRREAELSETDTALSAARSRIDELERCSRRRTAWSPKQSGGARAWMITGRRSTSNNSRGRLMP